MGSLTAAWQIIGLGCLWLTPQSLLRALPFVFFLPPWGRRGSDVVAEILSPLLCSCRKSYPNAWGGPKGSSLRLEAQGDFHLLLYAEGCTERELRQLRGLPPVRGRCTGQRLANLYQASALHPAQRPPGKPTPVISSVNTARKGRVGRLDGKGKLNHRDK